MGVGGHGVARLSERIRDIINREVGIVEGDCQRVVVHVGLYGIDILDLLDGRTGRRGGFSSDHARGLEDIGDRLRGSDRDETEKESQGKQESTHESLRLEIQERLPHRIGSVLGPGLLPPPFILEGLFFLSA